MSARPPRRAFLAGAAAAGAAGLSVPASGRDGGGEVIRDRTIRGGLDLTGGRTTVENCVIEGGKDGVHVGGSAEVTISNCVIRNVERHGVHVTSPERVQILNSRIHHCGQNGIRIEGASAKNGVAAQMNCIVSGNYIHDIASPWGDGPTGNAISGWRAHGIQVSGNRCERFVYSAVRFADCHDTIVTGNYCRGGQSDAQVFLEFGFHGSIVANNHFAGGAVNGLEAVNFLTGDGGKNYQGREVVIAGNRFTDFKLVAAKLEADIVFVDNILSGGQWGVLAGWGDACRNVTVAGNLIMNAKWGVGVTTSSVDPVIVRDNRFFGVDTPIAAYRNEWSAIKAGNAARPVDPKSGHLVERNVAGGRLVAVY